MERSVDRVLRSPHGVKPAIQKFMSYPTAQQLAKAEGKAQQGQAKQSKPTR